MNHVLPLIRLAPLLHLLLGGGRGGASPHCVRFCHGCNKNQKIRMDFYSSYNIAGLSVLNIGRLKSEVQVPYVFLSKIYQFYCQYQFKAFVGFLAKCNISPFREASKNIGLLG
jgi:hypothetical protein